MTEFLVEYYFFSSWKTFGYFNYIGKLFINRSITPKSHSVTNSVQVGLLLLIIGQACRTIAMFSAKSNFSHHIVDYKERDHVLVQHGIYSVMRHPSYFGFYWWAVGVQLLLINPICLLLFVYWLQKFFSERIAYEEHTLEKFFKQEWIDYKAKTPTLMPFIP